MEEEWSAWKDQFSKTVNAWCIDFAKLSSTDTLEQSLGWALPEHPLFRQLESPVVRTNLPSSPRDFSKLKLPPTKVKRIVSKIHGCDLNIDLSRRLESPLLPMRSMGFCMTKFIRFEESPDWQDPVYKDELDFARNEDANNFPILQVPVLCLSFPLLNSNLFGKFDAGGEGWLLPEQYLCEILPVPRLPIRSYPRYEMLFRTFPSPTYSHLRLMNVKISQPAKRWLEGFPDDSTVCHSKLEMRLPEIPSPDLGCTAIEARPPKPPPFLLTRPVGLICNARALRTIELMDELEQMKPLIILERIFHEEVRMIIVSKDKAIIVLTRDDDVEQSLVHIKRATSSFRSIVVMYYSRWTDLTRFIVSNLVPENCETSFDQEPSAVSAYIGNIWRALDELRRVTKFEDILLRHRQLFKD